jgi:hypothetical protein
MIKVASVVIAMWDRASLQAGVGHDAAVPGKRMVNLAQPRPSVRQNPKKQSRQLRELCATRHWDTLRECEDRARNRPVKSAFNDLWSFRGITFHTPKLGNARIDVLLWNSVFVSAINELGRAAIQGGKPIKVWSDNTTLSEFSLPNSLLRAAAEATTEIGFVPTVSHVFRN